MRLGIINSEEKELLNKIEASNDSDVSLWKVSNIIIPVITVCLSLVCFTIFKSKDKTVEIAAYFNLLLNGSIPMIALNRIGAMGLYIFKYNPGKEKSYGMKTTYFLRTKLFLWLLLVVLCTMILYIYLVSNNPFKISWWIILPFCLSVLSVIFSVRVAKQVYLLQESMIDNTYYNSVNDGAQQTKDHLNEKYGN